MKKFRLFLKKIRLFLKKKTNWELMKEHPRWNEKSLRIELTKEELERLPIKKVSKEEIYELMKKIDFNPTIFYSHKIKLKKNEWGHDLLARYTVKN